MSVCKEEGQPAQYILLSQTVPELIEYIQEAKSQTNAQLAGTLTEITDIKAELEHKLKRLNSASASAAALAGVSQSSVQKMLIEIVF